jgi:hypothetical protein
MATRKFKKYDEGGDVLARMMGTSSSNRDVDAMDPSENDGRSIADRVAGMRSTMDDAFNSQPEESNDRIPRMRNPVDEPPMNRGNNDKLAGQLTKLMGGSARGAGDGIPLGQREAMGTLDDGIPAAGVSNAKKALQDITSKKSAKDVMVEDLISSMGNQPKVAKIKSSYGNMGGFAKGGSVSKASSRADGIAQRGKTRGKMC